MSASGKPILAVLDTNVLLDVYSCHDLFNSYEHLGAQGVPGGEGIYRRARARESLLLAMVLDQMGAATFSLGDETLKKMTALVPPDDTTAYPTSHAVIMVNFVCPVLLPGWDAVIELRDDAPGGNAADEALLRYALDRHVPLITNEGFGAAGIRTKKLRAKAIRRGVSVWTPGEYCSGKIDAAVMSKKFVDSYSARAPEYFRSAPYPEAMRNAMAYTLGYFRHVLFGETNGYDEPLAVAVARTD